MLLLFLVPNVMTLFTIVATLAAILVIYIWGMILVACLAYRNEMDQPAVFRLPIGHYGVRCRYAGRTVRDAFLVRAVVIVWRIKARKAQTLITLGEKKTLLARSVANQLAKINHVCENKGWVPL